MLSLNDHTKRTIAMARKGQNWVRSLMTKKGLNSEGCQRIQVTAVQAVMLYGSELWWKRQKNRAHEVQKALNEQGRWATRCFRTRPQGALMNDGALRPATALLINRVRCSKLREMMMPDAQGGGKMIRQKGQYAHRVEGIDELITEEFLKSRQYEYATLLESRQSLGGKVIIQDEEQAKKEAEAEREGLVLWTDGLRKEDEWMGCAVVWKKERGKNRRVHLGRQKEAFGVEMYAKLEAMKIVVEKCREKEVEAVMIFMDSQVA